MKTKNRIIAKHVFSPKLFHQNKISSYRISCRFIFKMLRAANKVSVKLYAQFQIRSSHVIPTQLRWMFLEEKGNPQTVGQQAGVNGPNGNGIGDT